MLGRHQPRQQGRVKAYALTGFRESALEGHKTIVVLGQRQRTIQVLHSPTQGAAACIAVHAPDFIEAKTEFIVRQIMKRICACQAPVHSLGVWRDQLAQYPITRGLRPVQSLRCVKVAAYATAARCNIQPKLQIIRRQAFKPGIRTAKTKGPDPA